MLHLINAISRMMNMAKSRRGGFRPGAGAKPKPTEEHRRNRIMLNLLDDEYERLVDAAGEETPASYARRVLQRHLSRKPGSRDG